jgi:leucyl-tRNA synthetase
MHIISAYAERLLQGLNDIDWSRSIKGESAPIGCNVGAMTFKRTWRYGISPLFYYFGVTLTLAPRHELVAQITTGAKESPVQAYIEKETSKRSEENIMADVRNHIREYSLVQNYAEHPFTRTNSSLDRVMCWVTEQELLWYIHFESKT